MANTGHIRWAIYREYTEHRKIGFYNEHPGGTARPSFADIIRHRFVTRSKETSSEFKWTSHRTANISKPQHGREGAALFCSRTGRNGGLLWRWQWTFGFHQTPGIYWLASRQELCWTRTFAATARPTSDLHSSYCYHLQFSSAWKEKNEVCKQSDSLSATAVY